MSDDARPLLIASHEGVKAALQVYHSIHDRRLPRPQRCDLSGSPPRDPGFCRRYHPVPGRLSAPERVDQVLRITGRGVKRLYDAVADAPPASLDELVPPGTQAPSSTRGATRCRRSPGSRSGSSASMAARSSGTTTSSSRPSPARATSGSAPRAVRASTVRRSSSTTPRRRQPSLRAGRRTSRTCRASRASSTAT